MIVEMKVRMLVNLKGTQQWAVVLEEQADGGRYLPVMVDPYSAKAIAVAMHQVPSRRPLTHTLLNNVVEALGASLMHVYIDQVQGGTICARIVLDRDDRPIDVDCRASDAIALALQIDVPILVADAIAKRHQTVPQLKPASDPSRRSPGEDRLKVFREFVDGLDFNGFEGI